MGGKLDWINGRIKEAAGALADDDSLERGESRSGRGEGEGKNGAGVWIK